MKVIDLLNKIANGEEVPKKIKYNNKIWNYKDGIMEYISKDNCFSLSNFDFDELNDEVEIIEDKPFNERVEEIYNRHIDYIYDKEDKKIEKIKDLNTDYYDKCKTYDCLQNEEIVLDILTLKHKINEIIDYINKESK